MSNSEAHKTAARSTKLLRLLAWVPCGASRESNRITAEWLAALSVPERAIFAKLAGVNAPSEETWRQLLEAVRARKTVDEVIEAMGGVA